MVGILQEEVLKVYIVEASNSEDFFDQSLDGVSVHSFFNTIGIDSKLRMVLNKKYLKKAVGEAIEDGFDVLHLSCHGNDDGIALSDKTNLSWVEFAALFPRFDKAPALVMSSCRGAVKGISNAFVDKRHPPPFIFGSEKTLRYDTYAAAWALLYRQLSRHGLSRETGQEAMEHIIAVFHISFVYRRWDDKARKYLQYPSKHSKYEVVRKVD